ncbi:Amino acid ABC transporter, permease protein [Candidatus Burkholderia brachyanthoides]|nr:Amino acid ABC transporter, permease protein [Candidatus Burkholderia brachyanthoides]
MHWHDIADFVPILLQGAVMSVVITLGTLVLSTVLGLVWALLKMSRYPVVVRLVTAMINVVRGLPMIVLLFYIYFMLSNYHIQVTAFEASILGLGFGYSTITVAEMTREGQLIAASTFQNMTVYTLVAIGYLAMSLPLMSMMRALERRFGKHRAK